MAPGLPVANAPYEKQTPELNLYFAKPFFAE
jgi:hypothetical protein